MPDHDQPFHLHRSLDDEILMFFANAAESQNLWRSLETDLVRHMEQALGGILAESDQTQVMVRLAAQVFANGDIDILRAKLIYEDIPPKDLYLLRIVGNELNPDIIYDELPTRVNKMERAWKENEQKFGDRIDRLFKND